jgi:hypothetical protein
MRRKRGQALMRRDMSRARDSLESAMELGNEFKNSFRGEMKILSFPGFAGFGAFVCR